MPVFQKKPIPANIHYIWVGGTLPEKYLRTILSVAAAAKRSNFTLNLWVDDEKNFYDAIKKLKLTHELDPAKLGIKLRSINELKPRMLGKQADDFYKGNDPECPLNKIFTKGKATKGMSYAEAFWEFVIRESIGSKNLAAVADFLRYEILRQEGGYYYDVDIFFAIASLFKPQKHNLDFQPILKSDTPPFGIKLAFAPDIETINNGQISIKASGNNDAFGITPNHIILRKTLMKAIETYNEFDKSFSPEAGEALRIPKEFSQNNFPSLIDAKRFPFWEKYCNNKNKHPGCGLTLNTTGPVILMKALKDFWNKQENRSQEMLNETFTDNKRELMGMMPQIFCDSNWLQPKKDKKIVSHTTESISISKNIMRI